MMIFWPEIAPTEKAVSKLVLAGTKNEFRNLVGSSSFQLNISYREAECPNSHFRLLGSLNVCTGFVSVIKNISGSMRNIF